MHIPLELLIFMTQSVKILGRFFGYPTYKDFFVITFVIDILLEKRSNYNITAKALQFKQIREFIFENFAF